MNECHTAIYPQCFFANIIVGNRGHEGQTV